jgi:hypothetical protein
MNNPRQLIFVEGMLWALLFGIAAKVEIVFVWAIVMELRRL